MKNIVKIQPYLVLIIAFCGFLSVNAQRGEPHIPQVPIIGIITTAAGTDSDDSDSYIQASYSEFVEAGGAKAIPIPWNLDEDRFNLLLESVNGVLITGGEAQLWDVERERDRDRRRGGNQKRFSKYQQKLASVVDFVIDKKDDGVHFPLWATGQGLESVALALTEDTNLLNTYVHKATMGKVYFTSDAKKSVMFKNFTQGSFDFLRKNLVMYYDHDTGLNTSVPNIYPVFKSDGWIVTGTGKDINSKEFLAAMESKDYPIYAVMFHPEKLLYEANHDPQSTHQAGAILATKLMAKAFISEASKNENKFENRELLNALLIENFEAEEEDEILYYAVDKDTVNAKWGTVESSHGFIKFIIIILLIIGAFIGYNKYRQSKGYPEITYRSVVDEIERRRNNNNNNYNNNNNNNYNYNNFNYNQANNSNNRELV